MSDNEMPDNFLDYSPEIQEDIRAYINQMTSIERKACKIAKEHLGTSFDLPHSNGFVAWKKKQEEM